MPYSLEEDLKAAGAAGFEGVEIWSSKLDQYLESHSVDDLRCLLEDNGLEVGALCPYSLVCFGEETGEDRLKQAAEISAELDCETLLVCPDSPPEGMGVYDAFRKAGERAAQRAEDIALFGVDLAIEPLGGHPFVPGPMEAIRIIDEADHPGVGLMMDTFHYYKSGVGLADIGAIPIELLKIVHVNNCEELPRNELTDKHRLYLDEGAIPLQAMFGILKAMRYQGFLSVEIFRDEYWAKPAEEIAKASKASLDKVLATLM
jgi:2-keto-myo-inositol isomerase